MEIYKVICKELFEKQKENFLSRVRYTSCQERIKKLKALKEWILTNDKSIIQALYKDLGKPENEVYLSEIKPVLGEIDNVCSNLRQWMRSKKIPFNLLFLGTRSKIIYEPKGVVLILSPWNFPFNLTIGPLVSAIAAGNCVLLKPSEYTPHTTALIAGLIKDIFNENHAAVIEGDYRAAEELLKLPFDHIFFTGSPQVGKKVMKAAAEHLSSVTLELGGMNPVIVEESADIEDAAEKLLFGKFLNAGQSCLAPNYIMVQEKIYPLFLESLKKIFVKMYGDIQQMEKNQDYGRIVSKSHFQRLDNLVKDALEHGTKVLLGGNSKEEERYISPTILYNVPPEALVMQEEIFGPVMVVLGYRHIE
jgi:aldehyde dehydrogenase (NAD+)